MGTKPTTASRTVLQIIIIITIALLIVIPVIALTRTVSDEAPTFDEVDIDGKRIDLEDHIGDRVIVLDFMFTDCTGCKAQMPILVDIEDQFGDDILMVTLDVYHGDSKDDVDEFRDEYNADWSFVLAAGTSIPTDFEVTETPMIVIIDLEGRISFRESGVTSEKVLEEEIEDAMETRSDLGWMIVVELILLILMIGLIYLKLNSGVAGKRHLPEQGKPSEPKHRAAPRPRRAGHRPPTRMDDHGLRYPDPPRPSRGHHGPIIKGAERYAPDPDRRTPTPPVMDHCHGCGATLAGEDVGRYCPYCGIRI